MLDPLTSLAFTPDGGLADPTHPIYMLLWALNQIGVL